MSEHTVSATANFLLARLRARGDMRWIGRSADAMVVAAITGEEPTDRPHDGWDLGRCMVTRAVAPEHLHEPMDRILAEWAALIEQEPWWEVDGVREMAASHVEDVRKLVGS